MSRCGIVILAAGASTRMGTPKQSLVFDGSTLLARAIRTALDSQCRPVVVVLGSGGKLLQKSITDPSVMVLMNQQWQGGMGTSIRTGIAAIELAAIDAAMIFLCDQPLVTSAALNAMLITHFASGKTISAAHYGGSHGTPAIFNRPVFPELIHLTDGQGGKAVIQRYADQVHSIYLPEAEADVDTRDDFDQLSSHVQ